MTADSLVVAFGLCALRVGTDEEGHGVFTLLSRPLRLITSRSRRRWLWGAMAAIHTPALVSSFWALTDGGPNPGRLGGFLALALAMLFFISKIRGVKVLEFATHRRSVLTIAIAVVLIHADAIGTYLQLPQVPATVPVAATTLLAAGLTSVQEAGGGALSGTARTSKRPRRLTPALGAAWFGLFGRHRLTLVACLCAPRAPPA